LKIGVFGLGYIGYSTSVWFANAGVEVIGTDIDYEKVDKINSGEPPTDDMIPILPSGEIPEITATTDWGKLIRDESIDAFFIAVPTERDGEPWWKPLKDVVGKLVLGGLDPLTIIESTMAVGTVDKIIKPRLNNVVVAPRRDWFTEPTRNLKTLPRIVGGTTEENTRRAIKILSLVCDELISCTYREAELVKAYENAYRHLSCILAQQLALAYPDTNIRHVLEMGGTKWNVENLYPNVMGTGGYCIPLAPKYVLEGAKYPERLTLIKEAVRTDDEIVQLFSNMDYSIGCLGLAYLGNIKVHVLSPLIRLLKVLNIEQIKVNDPLYSDEELINITGCKTFEFPQDLDKFEAILLLTSHDEYRNVESSQLVQNTEHCKFIFDNTGLWKDIEFKCPYYLSGQSGWMNFLESKPD